MILLAFFWFPWSPARCPAFAARSAPRHGGVNLAAFAVTLRAGARAGRAGAGARHGVAVERLPLRRRL